MESKILNFPDAMRLAQIVSKYIDAESIEFGMQISEFLASLLKKITPKDYSIILQILHGLDMKKLGNYTGDEIVESVINGMKNNNLVDLLIYYKKIGFTDG